MVSQLYTFTHTKCKHLRLSVCNCAKLSHLNIKPSVAFFWKCICSHLAQKLQLSFSVKITQQLRQIHEKNIKIDVLVTTVIEEARSIIFQDVNISVVFVSLTPKTMLQILFFIQIGFVGSTGLLKYFLLQKRFGFA